MQACRPSTQRCPVPRSVSPIGISSVAGGQTASEQSGGSPAAARATSARASVRPSALSPFIFQLPAISLRTRDLHRRVRSTTPRAPAASGQEGSRAPAR